jgi:hypothetical protein
MVLELKRAKNKKCYKCNKSIRGYGWYHEKVGYYHKVCAGFVVDRYGFMAKLGDADYETDWYKWYFESVWRFEADPLGLSKKVSPY